MWSQRRPKSTLVVLRGLHVLFVVAIAGVIATMAYFLSRVPRPDDPPRAVAVVLVVVGLATALIGPRFAPRLDPSGEQALLRSFTMRLVTRIAIAVVAVTFTLVACLVVREWWALPTAVVAAAVGLASAAPTRAAVVRDTRDLAARGHTVPLHEVLSRQLPGPST